MTRTPWTRIIRSYRSLVPILLCASASSLAAAASDHNPRPTLSSKVLNGPGTSNHPVRVVPSPAIRIPEGWPLDVDGSITCMTCHHELPGSRQQTGALLRDFDDGQMAATEFCAKCHTLESQRNRAAVHWLAIGAAHVRADQSQSGSHRLATFGLDTQTRQCLGCHDGVSAGDSLNKTPWERSNGSLEDNRRNHPVGVHYPDRTPRNISVPFRPASSLPERIRLPEGKVGCVSCHDLYAGDEHLLTVPIEGSELCFACHDLK